MGDGKSGVEARDYITISGEVSGALTKDTLWVMALVTRYG